MRFCISRCDATSRGGVASRPVPGFGTLGSSKTGLALSSYEASVSFHNISTCSFIVQQLETQLGVRTILPEMSLPV